jgi:hypothetical protein
VKIFSSQLLLAVEFLGAFFSGRSSGSHLEVIGTIKPQKLDARTPVTASSCIFWHLGALRAFLWGMKSSPRRHFGAQISQSGRELGPNHVYTILEVQQMGYPMSNFEGPNSLSSPRCSSDKIKKNVPVFFGLANN